MSWLLLLGFIGVVWLWPIALCIQWSKAKNRRTDVWTLLAVLFGWFAVFAILLSPKIDKK